MLINAGKSYISDGINLESLLILQTSEMINKDVMSNQVKYSKKYRSSIMTC